MIYRVFTGERLIFRDGESVHEVEILDTKSVKDLIDGRGYIKGDIVYIYRGELTDDSKKVGLYVKDDHMVFIEPKNEQETEKYSINHIKEIHLDLDAIIKEIAENKDEFLDSEVVEIINANAEVSKFEIREDDDFLKKIIKQAIHSKEINLKNYTERLSKKHDLGNMISVLNKSTKMSVVNFKRFCEMLGLKWKLIVEDDGTDVFAPLEEPLEIDSDNQ